MMYPANAFDSRLCGDKVPLGSSMTKSQQKKKTFGLVARNHLSLSLPLSFSLYFFSKQILFLLLPWQSFS